LKLRNFNCEQLIVSNNKLRRELYFFRGVVKIWVQLNVQLSPNNFVGSIWGLLEELFCLFKNLGWFVGSCTVVNET
jgi:hypothetical protein